MLRRVAASLADGAWAPMARAAQAAGYATKSTSDYALVFKQSSELAVTPPVPDNEVGFCAGIPLETYARKARIYSPARTASQSGYARTLHPSSGAPAWKLEFDNVGKWTNPLMGWTSSADTLENVGRATMFFYTKEEAIDFARKHGWVYTVDEPNQRKTTRQKCFASYGDNFSTKKKGNPDMSYVNKK